jgi:proteasome lid subunit RPN8/RPN11
MTAIALPRHIINQILEQAQGSPDAEVCGLIGSRDGKPTRCYPVANDAEEPRHHFLMDPRQQIDAMRAMRENDESLFAIYHSHPDAPALPSAEDLQQAAYPEAYYLIVSLATEGTLQLRAFQLQGHTTQPVEVIFE